jgi:hypothetical protein
MKVADSSLMFASVSRTTRSYLSRNNNTYCKEKVNLSLYGSEEALRAPGDGRFQNF